MGKKFTPDKIIQICEEYLSGQKSTAQLCAENGLGRGKAPGVFWRWIAQYRKNGPSAFEITGGNRSYSAQLKQSAVEAYLHGKGSLLEICTQYHIRCEDTLCSWISCYNANMELKDYNQKREVYMAESRRKTTLEEREEIVAHCIAQGNDYKGTAALYNVSYSQVYSWVKKYQEHGKDGLTDRRGRHKRDEEVDELERLHRENLRLKRQLKERDMLVELLKKVKELEGM